MKINRGSCRSPVEKERHQIDTGKKIGNVEKNWYHRDTEVTEKKVPMQEVRSAPPRTQSSQSRRVNADLKPSRFNKCRSVRIAIVDDSIIELLIMML